MYGKPPKEPAPPKRPRGFSWVNRSGHRTIIEADRVSFTSNHVVFWRVSADDGQDFLVEAIESTTVTNIEEVEDLI